MVPIISLPGRPESLQRSRQGRTTQRARVQGGKHPGQCLKLVQHHVISETGECLAAQNYLGQGITGQNKHKTDQTWTETSKQTKSGYHRQLTCGNLKLGSFYIDMVDICNQSRANPTSMFPQSTTV
jgi:hypothetical protein